MNRKSHSAPDEAADRKHAEQPRHQERMDDGHAFVPDPLEDDVRVDPAGEDAASDLAEELAEEYMLAATANIDVGEQALDRVNESEVGGPFLVVNEDEEYAYDVEESNPPDATREPFPTAVSADGVPQPARR